VITTPFSFIATASSAVWEGLDVVFADICPDSFNINLAEVERNISNQTSAIVPVHVFGNPCDVNAIEELADRYGLKVIYDAAHAFAVRYHGESILNWGDISMLSFHATKLFHTIEGGALIINDDALCEQVRSIVNFGISGPESIERLGINAKMNEFQAAMGLSLLDKIDEAIVQRGKLVAIYDSFLKKVVQRQKWTEGATENNHYYPVLFQDENMVKKVQGALNRYNIYPRRYFVPSLDSLDFLSGEEVMTVSRDVASRILCLPLFADLSDKDCYRIAEIVYGTMREN
jgi:dTDP-4-amino-4,6-dideoxygalactose transaminase